MLDHSIYNTHYNNRLGKKNPVSKMYLPDNLKRLLTACIIVYNESCHQNRTN